MSDTPQANRHLAALLVLGSSLASGCKVIDEILAQDGLSTDWDTATADNTGVVTVTWDVPTNASSLLLTAESSALLAVDSVYDPNGELVLYWDDWYGADESLTYAFYPESEDVVLNWPIRGDDPEITGGTWTIYLGAYEPAGGVYEAVPGVPVDLTKQLKVDPLPTRGTVAIDLVFADGVGSDDDIVAATEAAIERWEEVWAPYDLYLEVTMSDLDLDADLAMPGEDSALAEASELSTRSDVTVVIGETIDGSVEYYGVAGSVPGALVESARAGVVVSWLANAGGDGHFSDDDIQLYGETLAHEVGHFVGLFHPVESSFDMWDALDDTDACTSQSSCEGVLGDNNLFPYPMCSWTSCEPQDVLSDEQIDVAQGYTGTL